MTAQGEKVGGRGREAGGQVFSVALNELDNMPMREREDSISGHCLLFLWLLERKLGQSGGSIGWMMARISG